jgi:hypothetical protein
MTSPVPRSNRVEVRNPILALPAFRAVYSLPDETKVALASLLDNLSRDAEAKAQTSWLKKKGPMAAYWKACAVYAKHIARAIRKSCCTKTSISAAQSPEAHNENQDTPARAA